jgi:hypothetical protein
MGSYSFFNFGDYRVDGTKNYLDTWYFGEADRKIVTPKDDEQEQPIENEGEFEDSLPEGYRFTYEVTAKRFKRRLELAGWNRATIEQEFKEAISYILEYAHDLEHAEMEIYFDLLRDADFEEWLSKLSYIVKNNLQPTYWGGEPCPETDPIVRYLLSHSDYFEYFDELPYLPVNFPCKTFEGFVRALLEFLPNDDLCILDATDLVYGGWVDAFDDLVEATSEFTEFCEVFNTALVDIRELMSLGPDNDVLVRLLYANSITAMEAYLSDTLKKQVVNRPALLRRFVETNEGLNSRKIVVGDLFRVHDNIKDDVIDIIDKITFHNLSKAIGIYKSVFGVEFPVDVKSSLAVAVENRHDIVHRNGKNTSGQSLNIMVEDIDALLCVVETTVHSIDRQVKDGLLE